MLVKKIDIHVHTTSWADDMPRFNGARFATPEELCEIYDRMGIELGVLLPAVNPEAAFHNNTNRDCCEIAERYPEKFVWFCNIDPRMGKNSPDTDFTHFLEYYKSRGAKGVGEVTANMYFDDPMVENLFYHVEKAGLPITFHIGNPGNDIGIIDEEGLPRLEKALLKFPKLIFLGHSQKFWAEISSEVGNRDGYPQGKVKPGGRLVELMRKYPNLHGDLSSGSGQNAIMRDPEFGYKFLEEFQDRLYFGTDICTPKQEGSLILSKFLDDAVENRHISQECYNKVCRENTLRLLKMDKQ